MPVLNHTRDRGHGRVELRTLRAVSVCHFGFPHAAQVIQVARKTRDLGGSTRRWRTVVVYAITSLPFEQASPARLADLIRGHVTTAATRPGPWPRWGSPSHEDEPDITPERRIPADPDGSRHTAAWSRWTDAVRARRILCVTLERREVETSERTGECIAVPTLQPH
jgi:hypothetical protein